MPILFAFDPNRADGEDFRTLPQLRTRETLQRLPV
jgi:hypothetical protein